MLGSGARSRDGFGPGSVVRVWFVSYALLGVTVAGVVPIALPLLAERFAGPSGPGLVMGAYNLGMLGAPGWGALADRSGRHRAIYAAGLAVVALAVGALSLQRTLGWFVLAALAAGLGASATVTVASLFITERHARRTWPTRFGWLQAFYGGGQVAGLLVAGAFGAAHDALALAAAALFALVGFGMVRTVPVGAVSTRPMGVRPHVRLGDLTLGAVMGRVHAKHLLAGLSRLPSLMRAGRSAFLAFLMAWLLNGVGGTTLFAFYPLVMNHVFALGAGVASLTYAGAVAVRLLLFGQAVAGTKRLGAAVVFRAGVAVRLAAFLVLAVTAAAHPPHRDAIAFAAFAVAVMAWALLGVSGPDLAAETATLPKGQAMGLYSAFGAVASVCGALVGSVAATAFGYGSLAWVGSAFLLAALVIAPRGPRGARAPRPTAPDDASERPAHAFSDR